LYPVSHDRFKSSFSGGHKLGAVIERSLANPASRQPAAQTSPFVDNQHAITPLGQIVSCTEASKASTNNKDIGVVGHRHSFKTHFLALDLQRAEQ
jgi:hypothetical protein